MTMRSARVVYLVALAFAASPFFYAAFRAIERLAFTGAEPSHVYFVERSGYFARVALSLFAGGIAAAVSDAVTQPSRGAALGVFATASTLSVVACAALFP